MKRRNREYAKKVVAISLETTGLLLGVLTGANFGICFIFGIGLIYDALTLPAQVQKPRHTTRFCNGWADLVTFERENWE